MIEKSKGIVLSYIKYKDTSIIARIFTEQHGFGSFIVNSIRSQKSSKSIGYFQPFCILDLVLYIKESRELQRISEFRNHIPLHSIHSDFTKGSITLFLAEVFSKLLQTEQAANQGLYAFAEASIKTFDLLKTGIGNFHIQFLLKLASHLGFEIEEADHLFSSIDKLVPQSDGHLILERMLKDPYGTPYDLNRTIRNDIVESILHFYGHHAQIRWPKSLAVLRSVLN